jgi:hypothetical protein
LMMGAVVTWQVTKTVTGLLILSLMESLVGRSER